MATKTKLRQDQPETMNPNSRLDEGLDIENEAPDLGYRAAKVQEGQDEVIVVKLRERGQGQLTAILNRQCQHFAWHTTPKSRGSKWPSPCLNGRSN